MADPVITAFVWDSYSRLLADAGRKLGADVRTFSRVMFADSRNAIQNIERSMMESDVVLVHLMGASAPDEIEPILRKLPERVKVLSMGKDPMAFSYTTGPKDVALGCFEYLEANGRENCEGCILYLLKNMFGKDVPVPEVVKVPGHGIIDADGRRFGSLEDYISEYPPIPDAPWVGILTSRTSWVNDNCDVEYELARTFKRKGINVIMAYASPRTVPSLDLLCHADTIDRYMRLDGKFLPSAIVKCSVVLIGHTSSFGEEKHDDFLESLNVPVFQPVIASSMSKKTFESSPGLKSDVSFGITFQEFEGTIEPMLIGFSREDETSETRRTPIPERIEHLTDRVIRRIDLGIKPNKEKKIAFILNNYPCANADANVGEARNLNVMDSLANILARMKSEGYDVTVPENGKEIIDRIMEHKALSDFRWTDSSEIERCGGVLHHMTVGEYREWFDTLSQKVRDDVIRVWGEPPGQSMVRNDEILITGIELGNALIMVQPKRGCYGAKCDGTVCRILHDPVCPPTHQYLATYHWLDSVWKADILVHTGCHGNLENLPGKDAGLTSDCYPDICIGTMPHMYIFDAASPPAATNAKRRSYATLIDHLPPAMERVRPYGPLEKMRVALDQYDTAKNDPLRAAEYRKLLVDTALELGVDAKDLGEEKDLQMIVKLCTEEYSRLASSKVSVGMHTFGVMPDVHAKATMITSVLAYGTESICRKLAASKGIDYAAAEAEPDGFNEKVGKPNALITSEIFDECLRIVEDVLSGRECPLGPIVNDEILEISKRIDDSDEIGAFMNSIGGGYVSPGPCGLISRGRKEVLPTGRNTFSIDPRSVPTKVSWKTGMILADKTIDKYRADTGEIPETVSMFWTSSDLVNEGGEMMSQILYLIGARPTWTDDGQVEGFEVLPLEELGRPRIDVTIRSSGILMEGFPNLLDLLDSAIVAVSALDESAEDNYVKKHTLESIADGIPAEDATARLFSSAPGSASSGVSLAVYANAWKTERDLADIYVANNGYAYGNERNGKPLHRQFMNSLSSSSISYSKMGTDEHNILGSPGYFGNIGGMSIAARALTGRDVKEYFGDTRVAGSAGVHTLKDEIRRVTKTMLLNPQWIEGMKKNGYQGAAEIMKRSGTIYGYGATTKSVDDSVFDDIATTFINNPDMMRFFRENNPHAGEEIARRLLEASERGFWKADPAVLEKLKDNYMIFEGDLEGIAGDGDYQGSTTEIADYSSVDAWKESNSAVMDSVRKMMDSKTKKD